MIGIVDYLLFCLLGVGIGVSTGLFPGLHPNNLAVILISFSPFFLNYVSPVVFAVLVLSISVSHAIINFIPSIFLGAPAPNSTSLSVLPGHQMLLKGRGYEAVKLTTFGCLMGALFSICSLPLVLRALPLVFKLVRPYVHFILISVIGYMIFREESWENKLFAFLILLISGLFGYVVLNFPGIKNPLFPSLTGLFGLSTLLLSLKEESYLPKQKFSKEIGISKENLLKSSGAGFFANLILSFLPGVGPAQAAVLASEIFQVTRTSQFLVTLGSINLVDIPVSLMALYSFGRPRSGPVAMMQKVLTRFSFNIFLLMIFTVLFASGLVALITLSLSRKISGLLSKIDYHKLSLAVIAILVGLIFWLTGPLGVLTAVTGTFIGLTCALLKVKRSFCMGFLLCPTILFFFGI